MYFMCSRELKLPEFSDLNMTDTVTAHRESFCAFIVCQWFNVLRLPLRTTVERLTPCVNRLPFSV